MPDGQGSEEGISRRMAEVLRHDGVLLEALDSVRAELEPLEGQEPCDFRYGNPKEDPIPQLVEALRDATTSRGPQTFAYIANDPTAQQLIADRLGSRFGRLFNPADVSLTCGAFGALAAALFAVVDEGDEVVVNKPSWPFYSMMICTAGGTPVDIDVRRDTWDLDLGAIEAALSERTRVVVVNSPNNPTGRIYPAPVLEGLAELLTAASHRYGRRIYLVSDESYSKVVYDQRPFVTPTSYYANSFLVHTYLKTVLAPGLRIGYIALPPSMQDRDLVLRALHMVQLATGWAFPTATLQYAVAAFERLSIDLETLERKRDRMVAGLRGIGYRVHVPEGTFYVLPEAPNGDAVAFTKRLERHGVLVLAVGGRFRDHFRISLTATEETVERSFAGFRASFEEARH